MGEHTDRSGGRVEQAIGPKGWGELLMRPVLSARIALLATVVLVVGCGGSVSVDDRGQVAVGAKTLDVASIPFTLRYPVSFQEATDASTKAAHAVALVGVPGQDTYVAVHLNGETALSLDALEAQAHSALGANVVSTARASHAGIAMVAVTARRRTPRSEHHDVRILSAGKNLADRVSLQRQRTRINAEVVCPSARLAEAALLARLSRSAPHNAPARPARSASEAANTCGSAAAVASPAWPCRAARTGRVKADG